MKSRRHYIYLSVAMVLAGSSMVTGKILTASVPIHLSQTISTFIAFLVLVPLAIIIEGNPLKFKLRKADLLLLFLQSLVGMFLFRLFLLEGLKHTSALEGGIISSASPAILAILSFLLLKEVIHGPTKVGIILCMAGMIVITLASKSSLTMSQNQVFGNILVVMAVFCEALFSILRKKQSYTDYPITSTAYIVLISSLLFLPLGLRDLSELGMTAFTPSSLMAMVYYGAFCTALAYVCWFMGIAKVQASSAAGFTALMPITSIALSVLIFDDPLRAHHLIGTLVILMGLYLIAKPKPLSSKLMISDEG